MSIDGSGIVAFGVRVEDDALPFPWPPERQEWEFDEDEDPSDLGEYLAKRSGIVDPGPKAEDDAPIEIVRLGHYEGDPIYVVALKGTEISTTYQPIGLPLPVIDQARIDEAAAFCAANDICPFEEPKWLLGSSVG